MLEEGQARGLSLVDVGVDYTKVEPVQHKRTLAFINHFAIHTVHFLNRFSSSCEEKLSAVEERLRRLEVTINILDTKLSSVPGLEAVTGEAYQPPQCLAAAGGSGTRRSPQAPASNSNAPDATDGRAAPPQQPAAAAPTSAAIPAAPAAVPSRAPLDSDSDSDFDDESSTATGATSVSATPISKDPRYGKYFSLLKVGVPVAAFRNKMLAEGLDPNLMEDPDAPAPPPGKGGGGAGIAKPVDSDDMDDDDDDDDEDEDGDDEDGDDGDDDFH